MKNNIYINNSTNYLKLIFHTENINYITSFHYDIHRDLVHIYFFYDIEIYYVVHICDITIFQRLGMSWHIFFLHRKRQF